MALFKYQNDGTASEEGSGAHSRSNGKARMDLPIINNHIGEDYDLQAALDVEQADIQGDWEPHDYLYNGFAASKASSSKAPHTQQDRPLKGQQPTKNHGKGRQVFDIDDDEDNEDGDLEVIPVPIDEGGSVISDARVEQISREIDSIDEQIASLKAARAILADDRQALLNQQKAAQNNLREKQRQTNHIKPLLSAGVVNYSQSTQFSWKKKLDGILDRVFGIKRLRLCQEGVLNAVLDGRDVICIMPTGGGKSVCFQAPALMSKGVTLVISPLLSLMADQVLGLNAKGVEAVMITGSTPHTEIKDITERLTSRDGNIKLCYVTPEKLAKSKTFANTLGKMYSSGLLSRIAIDESHCCSQMGHDFRPDYKRLSMLKQLYPKTPIIALTATCGKAVLNDVVRILHLKSCTSGESAESNKTVFFSAPLYRSNLHYSIRIKPVQAPVFASEMAELILSRYPNSAGIIYCLSQKETETFAQAISECSGGKIKIGTYHAGMSDYDKESIHTRWREGRIKCVVATIAFGMGIDASDVRYVFHQTISKSMEGYYQETGRAGRDGKDSDCILWFRPADASRLSTLTLGEVEGQKKCKPFIYAPLRMRIVYKERQWKGTDTIIKTKVHTMLKYALDFKTCRKLLFDTYFGNPANVVAPFAESDRTICGHCDNCLRSKANLPADETNQADNENDGDMGNVETESSVVVDYARKQQVLTRDVTIEAWKICKIIKAADNLSSRVTLPGAADLCRGLSKCTFPTKNKDVKASLDLDQVCDGKVTSISKDDMEMLLLELLLQGYLKEEFVQTAYTINSYIVSGPQSIRLTRLKEEQIEESGIKVELSTLATVKPAKGKGKKKSDQVGDDEDGDSEAKDEAQKTQKPKRKRKSTVDESVDSASEVPAEKGTGKKKKAAKADRPAKKPAARKKKEKDKEGEVTEKAPVKKKPKKPVSDSDEDWEAFGLNPAISKASAKLRGNKKVQQDSEVEDEDVGMGVDSDIAKIPSDPPGFDDSEDDEEGSLAYPFIRDRFSKRREGTSSAKSKAASAAVKRAEDGPRVIDLDSFD